MSTEDVLRRARKWLDPRLPKSEHDVFFDAVSAVLAELARLKLGLAHLQLEVLVVGVELASLRGRLAEAKRIHEQDYGDMARQNKDMERLRELLDKAERRLIDREEETDTLIKAAERERDELREREQNWQRGAAMMERAVDRTEKKLVAAEARERVLRDALKVARGYLPTGELHTYYHASPVLRADIASIDAALGVSAAPDLSNVEGCDICGEAHESAPEEKGKYTINPYTGHPQEVK